MAKNSKKNDSIVGQRPPNPLSRRSFLRGAAAGATAVTAAPWVFVPRKAFAGPAFGAADSVIILYAGGGLRSQPLFNADVSLQMNPFGLASNVAPGTEWGVGSILGQNAFPLFSFGDVTEFPAVPQIANDIAVLAGVDHDPSSSMPVAIDHGTGDMSVTTGRFDDMPGSGLLSMIHRDHPGYVGGDLALPPFDLGLSNFARGEGDLAGYRPIAIGSANEFTGKSSGSVEQAKGGWARNVRNARDTAFIAKRAPHVQPYLGAVRDAKLQSANYSAAIRNPALDLLGAPEATLGGVTNQQLLEVLGGGAGQEGAWGLDTAFALRLVQMGVPGVSVMRYLYDSHSDEKTLFPMDAADIGRQLAGMHFLLHRMTNANGQPLWNRTVVIMVSEFSRDNTEPTTGFNSADGSDHNGSPASRNQCWPIMGGPITAGGKRIGQLDPNTLATVGGPATSVRSVLSTLLDVLGIDHTRYWSDAPVASLFL